MKKRTQNRQKKDEITPEEALDFLESLRKITEDVDEPTRPISLRVPANLLRAVKTQAKLRKTKYQTLIIEYLRQGLKS